MQSFTEENYLKAIYKLQEQNGETVANSDLAKMLEVQSASVTDMLKKMARKKLINYEKSKGFRLTDKGRQIAISIIRKHRLWEVFLLEKLGFAWNEVHDLAEQLEHIQSERLIDRLDDYLGNPKSDPHGDPIPDANGKMPVLSQVSLNNFPLKKNGIVSSVSNQTGQMMEMLNHYGIGIGSKIKVLKTFDFDGSLQIKISKQPACIISQQAAQNIFVYDDQ